MPALRASIVVIGDEILGGYVADTNSGWLAGRLSALGIPLDRVVTVPDTETAIHEALRTELDRSRPRLVITSGGIGSTPDDLTMASVASFMGVGLVTEPTIDEAITAALERSVRHGAVVTPRHEAAVRTMALVPDTSRLLAGAEGVAPGVAIDLDGGIDADQGALIVVLPGVPGEFRRLATDALEPVLEGRGVPPTVVEITHPYPESVLTPLLEDLVAEHPDVHVGSYPGRECLVRLKGSAEAVAAARARIDAELARLEGAPGAQAAADAWAARWQD